MVRLVIQCRLLALLTLTFLMTVAFSWAADDSKLILAAQAGSLETVTKAIQEGANPNVLMKLNSYRELSPLMAACLSGKREVIEYLIRSGAVVDLQNSAGETALMIAVSRGDEDTIRLLLKSGAHVEIKDNTGRTAAERAAEVGRFSIVKLLTGNEDSGGRLITASLIGAVHEGSLTRLKEMIQKGANVNGTSEGGETALTIASAYCRTEIVKILLNAGADVNLVEEVNGDSPLHFAAEQGCISIMALLLESGANPNVRNTLFGRTPLMVAANAGQYEAVKLLLSRGSDPSIRSDSGETALAIAIESGHAKIEALLQKSTKRE